MFQLAFGIAHSNRTGRELLVDSSILRDHSRGRHLVNRDFDLDIFQVAINEVPTMLRLRFNSHGLGFHWKVGSRLWRAVFKPSVVKVNGFAYATVTDTLPNETVYFSGLWQSYKYFQAFEEGIRESFRFKSDPPQSASLLISTLQENDAICLHVRRGDYITVKENAETIGFVGLDYYRRAVPEMLKNISGNPVFIVFSDDLPWCRSELDWLPGDTIFASYSPPEGCKLHHSDFQIMTHANKFITSNSTFAWWAAWLSNASDKIVIAPKRWFRDPEYDTQDLCPPDWIRL